MKHPFITALVDYKWWKFGARAYVPNFFVYACFLYFLTLFVLEKADSSTKFNYNRKFLSYIVTGFAVALIVKEVGLHRILKFVCVCV